MYNCAFVEDRLMRIVTHSPQITQPAKAREQLVNQLKTQIVDLERFIEYLQTEGADGESWDHHLKSGKRRLIGSH